MITFDTIRFEICLSYLSKLNYDKVENALSDIKVQYGKSSLFLRSSLSPLELQVKEFLSSNDINTYQDENGQTITQKDINYYYLPSYSYKINIIRQNDNITCEFSIPKFLYGHNLNVFPSPDYVNNLYQFELDEIRNKYEFGKCTDGFISFICLKHFLNEFLTKFFGVGLVVLNPRILRLDLSYNYRFSSAESFENFQSHMTKFFNNTNKSNRYTNYNNETFFKGSKQYSVKVYNKQAEFLKHDYDKLKNYFSMPFWGFSDEITDGILKRLLDFSKNVWRCEISLRPQAYFNALYTNYEIFDFPNHDTFVKNVDGYKRLHSFRMCVMRLKKSFTYDSAANLQPLNSKQINTIERIIDKYFDVFSNKIKMACGLVQNGNSLPVLQKFARLIDFHFVTDCKMPDSFFDFYLYKQFSTCQKIMAGHELRFNSFGSGTILFDYKLLDYFHEQMKKYVNVISQVSCDSFELLSFVRLKKNDDICKKILGRKKRPFIDYLIARKTDVSKYHGYSKRQFERNEKMILEFSPYLKNNQLNERFNFGKIWQNIKIDLLKNDSLEKRMTQYLNNIKSGFSMLDVLNEWNEFVLSDTFIVYYTFTPDEMFEHSFEDFKTTFARNHEGESVFNYISPDDIKLFRSSSSYQQFERDFIDIIERQK